MGVLRSVLGKIMFWRRDDADDDGISACFTLPGAELDTPTAAAEMAETNADEEGSSSR